MIAELVSRIRVRNGEGDVSLPEWAATLIWLGFWCRIEKISGKRLVCFLVVPSRNLAAAFAGIGCLLAGAQSFAPSLPWPIFRAKAPGAIVYWRRKNGDRANYSGVIVDFPFIDGGEFIRLQIKKPAAAAKQGIVSISTNYFDEYQFSEHPFPTESREKSLNRSGAIISALQEGVDKNWIVADGVEGIVVTAMKQFETEASGTKITIDGSDALSVYELLGVARNGSRIHSKLSMTHPRGNLTGDVPLAILEGPDAFRIHEHLPKCCNLLVILERHEYQEGIHDTVLQLASVAEPTAQLTYSGSMPEMLPLGFEIAAYVVSL